MRVAAVVTDLDGTLVGDDFSITAATVAALDTIRNAGLPVIVATARTPQGLRHLEQIAMRTDVAVCCSGAVGRSDRQGCSWTSFIDPGAVREVVSFAIERDVGVAGFDADIWRMTQRYEAVSGGQPDGPTRLTVTPAALAMSRCATMAIRSERKLSGFEDIRSDRLTVALSRVGGSTVIDLTAFGVDKGTGVLRVLKALGINPEQAVSFGDMPNDLPMFAITGRSYAVGRGHPDVMAVADEILDPVAGDGFSQQIATLAAAGWVAA